ncbi:MAG TPA: metal-dependent hydrolase [Acidimicrobiales bacterium]|nr:metal-dependent hydrolase [Acidimicrobiales bacterium]
MSDLQVRQLPFSFEGVEFLWNPANRAFSVFGNCVSFWVIGLERYLVRIMKDADEHISDPKVRQEAKLFMQQEAVHAKTHRRHVKALIDRYPALQAALDSAIDSYDGLYQRRDLRYHLAYGAALEGTFTPVFGSIIDHRDSLFLHGDARVASLFLWHFCEEIEHRSSAVKVYDDVVGDNRYKAQVFPSVVMHVERGFESLLRDFQRSVPGEAGASHYGSRAARLFGRRANPFATIPVRRRLKMAGRAIASIRPGYDHAYQPIPAWTETWFSNYAQGHDMTQFYGTTV